MNIIKRELISQRKSIIIWSISIFLFVLMSMSKFSAFYNNPDMIEFLEMYPQGLLDAMGLGANLSTVVGYISVLALYIYMLLGVYSALLGGTIISKEERDKTAEYLYSLPVSRTKVIVSKLIVVIICSLFVNLVMGLSTIVSVLKYNPGSDFYQYMFLLLLAAFIIQMIFLSIGMLLAATIKEHKRAGYISLGIFFGTYMLSILLNMTDVISFMKILTPFAYFNPLKILNTNSLSIVYVLFSLLIVIISLTGTIMFYKKRDLKI